METIGSYLLIFLVSLPIVYLLFVLLFQWLPLASLSLTGSNAKFTDDGIMIYSKVWGHLSFVKWDEIAQVDNRFQPPLHYPILRLKNGKAIKLYMENMDTFMKSYEKYNSTIEENGHHE